MRSSAFILAFALLAAPLTAWTAQSEITASPSATTTAETAARGFIAAINGDAESRRAFAQSAFSTKSLETTNADLRRRWLNRLAADSGGFELVSVAVQGDRMVEAVVRSRTGGRFGKLVLFTSKSEPGRIADLFLLAGRDPAKVKAETWPTGPLSTASMAAQIDKRAAALAAEDLFSGVVLVARGNRLVLRRAYGLADQQWKVANRADTAFHLGSVSKMFTAAAVLRLAEQGKLSLDDSLSKWVPEFPHAEASKITLRHLLSHSAGIGDWDGRSFKEPMSGAEKAATMTAPLTAQPGARFQYSNAGFTLLGAVVEKATGKPLDEALDALVFQPAGMTRTGLWPVTAIVPNRATGYLRPENDPLGFRPRFSNAQFLGFEGDGSGGAYSTADDMFAFLSALADGRLLGLRAKGEMLTPRFDFAGSARPSKYGYGVDLGSCGGHPTFGHEGGGANSGVSSLAYRTLDTGWTVIVLSNYDPPFPGDLAHSICEFVAGR